MPEMEKENIKFAAAGEPRLLLLDVPETLSMTGEALLAYAIPVMGRDGGFMLAIPVDAFSDAALADGSTADDVAEVGPSKKLSAPLVEETDDGSEIQTGLETEYIIVDMLDAALAWASEYDPITDSTKEITCFHAGRPEAIPDVKKILVDAKSWTDGAEDGRANFYSARKEQEEVLPKAPKTKKAAAKKPTVAGLADQVSAMALQMQAMMTFMQETQAGQIAPATATLAEGPSPTRRRLDVPQMPAVSRTMVPDHPGGQAVPKRLTGLVGPPPKK